MKGLRPRYKLNIQKWRLLFFLVEQMKKKSIARRKTTKQGPGPSSPTSNGPLTSIGKAFFWVQASTPLAESLDSWITILFPSLVFLRVVSLCEWDFKTCNGARCGYRDLVQTRTQNPLRLCLSISNSYVHE